MAIVPEYGGPQVSPQVGAGAQGAQFHSMVAPKADPLAPFEKALTRVGREQAQLLAEQDDAIATDIETKYAQYCQQLLTDKDKGFLTLKGQSAVAPVNGEAPIDRMMNNASDYLKSLMDGRTKEQIALIKAKTNSRTNGLYASGMQHAMTENYNFNVSAQKGALEQAQNDMMTFFDQPDKLANARARLIQKADAYARLTGQSVKTVRMEAVAAGHKAAVLGFLGASDNDPSKYSEGMQYLKAHSKEMSPSDVFALGARLNDGMKRAESWRFADQIYAGTHIDPSKEEVAVEAASIAMGADGKPTLEGNEHYVVTKGLSGDHVVRGADGKATIARIMKGGEEAYGAHGVTRSMAEAVAGRKLTEEEWRDVKENPERNKAAAVAYLRREGQVFGDFDLAVAAYVGSEKEVNDAMAKAKKEGGVWSSYLSESTMKRVIEFRNRFSKKEAPAVYDTDGSQLNAFSAKFASRSYRRPSREEIYQIVRQHPLASDYQWLDQTVARIEARYTMDRQDYEQRHQAALDDACRAVEAGREPTEAQLSALTAREQQDFYAWKKKFEASDTTGDLEYAAKLMKNPADLAQLSETQLRNALRIVPKSSRGVLQKQWQELQNAKQSMLQAEYGAEHGQPQYGKTNATRNAVIQALKDFDGFGDLDEDQQALVATEVVQTLAENNAIYGIDTSDPTKAGAAILDMMNKRFLTKGFFGFWRGRKSILSFKYGDLPSDVQKAADEFGMVVYNRANGKDNDASKGERMAALVQFMTRKYSAIPDASIDKVMEDLGGADRVRQYVMDDAWKKYVEKKRGPLGRQAFEADIAPKFNNNRNVLRAFINAQLGGE